MTSARRRFATSSAASPAKRPSAVASTSSTRMCSLARSRKRATSAVSKARISVRASAARVASPRSRVVAASAAPASPRRRCAAAASAPNASSAGATASRRAPSSAGGVSSAAASKASASAARVATRRASAAARRRRERPVVATSEASSAPKNCAEAALRQQRLVAAQQAFGVLAGGEREDRRAGRVQRGLRDDALRGGLPGFALALVHAPQVDLGLHDEDRLDVPAHDAEERRVALGERLLRVDQVEHGVGAGQIRERRAAVGRVDRGQARRVGDHEAVAQERRVDRDPHQRGGARVVLVGRVVQLAHLADRDEAAQPPDRDAFLAAARIDGGRRFLGGVGQLGDGRGRGVDVGRQQADDARPARPLLERHLAQQRVEQERLAARELAHHRQHEPPVAQAADDAPQRRRILARVVPARALGDERAQFVQAIRDVVARRAITLESIGHVALAATTGSV